MPGVLLWAHLLVASTHRHFPDWSQCCGWINSCGSYDCKTHLDNNHKGTLKKNKIHYSQDWGLHGTPKGHTVRLKVEKEREYRPGILPLLGSEGGVPRVLWIYSWQILNIRAGIRVWEGKSGVTEVAVI